MSERIFLVGLPGSGKTTLGRKLAKSLNWKFIDLDDYIERSEHRTITQIFKLGEKVFRELEQKALDKIIDEHPQTVIATGGGAPCFFDNMNKMLRSGKVVFLDTPIDVILERISKEDHRPLLTNTDPRTKIESLNKERRSYYEKAPIVISNDLEIKAFINNALEGKT